MPAFAAKTAKKGEPAPPDLAPPDLRAEIERLWADCYAAFEERLDALKASRDGAGLPREILRQQLVGLDPCICKVMMRLLNDG
jgi:hypothetical protein